MSVIVPGGYVEHQLGVHIRQRHEDYLKDIGFGYGAIKDLYLSPVEWWHASPWNPLRDTSGDDAKKKAFQRGEALHVAILEGMKLYEQVYGFMPNRRSHPDALDTVEELRAACRGLGLPSDGLKPDLVARLVGAPKMKRGKPIFTPKALVLAHLQREFALTGKKPIDEADDFRIRMLHRIMFGDIDRLHVSAGIGEPSDITIKEALTGALTEVSFYWIDEYGIRHRARFDILKPNFTGDLKSITQWKRTDFKASLLEEIIRRGYMIQAAHYNAAREALRTAVTEGRVYGGTKTERKRLERIAEADVWAWINIFAKMDGAPQVRAIVTQPTSLQLEKARLQREEALAKFLYYRETFGGLDAPWFDTEVVWEPEEDKWPLFSVVS